MTPQVRVGGSGGIWLSTTAPTAGVEVDIRWGLGGYQLDFQMLLPQRVRPNVVQQGARCDLLMGGTPVFAGQISEVDWTQGNVTAIGLARVAETIPALTAGGSTTTSTPDTAIDTAISLGWPVTRPASISAASMATTDATDTMNMTAALLDLYANDNSKRWYVDPFGAVRTGVDPTTPEIYILPGAGELSWAQGDQATKIIGSYKDSATRKTAILIRGTGTTVRSVDLTSRGYLSSAQATTILDAILAQSLMGSWSGSLPALAEEQMVTPWGMTPSLAEVAAMAGRGLVIRLLGHRDPRPDRFSMVTDVVLGQVVWNVDDGTITPTPIGAQARDFSAIVESFGGTVTA